MRFTYINEPTALPHDALGLDAIIGVTFLLSALHAATNKCFSVIVAILLLALLTEQSSIQLGATHCHTDALAMVSTCSSVNSVVFYVAWMYTSLVATEALPFAKSGSFVWPALAMGLIQALFGLCYELQGPTFDWWQYNAENVAGAFDERVFGLPLMGVYFHTAFGAGFVAALRLVGIPDLKSSSIPRLLVAVLLTPALSMVFDGPVRAFAYFGITRFSSVPCLLFLLFVIPVIIAAVKLPQQPVKPLKARSLLLFIVLIWHAYFAAAAFWLQPRKPMSWEMYTCAITTSVASILLHFVLAFPSRTAVAEKNNNTNEKSNNSKKKNL